MNRTSLIPALLVVVAAGCAAPETSDPPQEATETAESADPSENAETAEAAEAPATPDPSATLGSPRETPPGKGARPPFRKYTVAEELARSGDTTPDGETPAEAVVGTLQVHVINVGQGDAILIRCPHRTHELLIDAGELSARYAQSEERFQDYIRNQIPTGRRIETVIATNPRSDHLGSMPWLLENYSVYYYVDSGFTSDAFVWNVTEEALKKANPYFLSVRAQEPGLIDVDFCPRADLSAKILRPLEFGQGAESNPGLASIVVRVDFGATSFLFASDCEEQGEARLLADETTRAALDVDFLKVARHGANDSNKPAFLAVVTPALAAISSGEKGAGTNAQDKHPRLATVSGLLEHVQAGASKEFEAYEAGGLVYADGAWSYKKGSWTRNSGAKALHATAGKRDLVFESDGTTITLVSDD